MYSPLALLLATLPLAAAEFRLVEEPIARYTHARFTGAAIHQGVVAAWGQGVVWNNVPAGKIRVPPKFGHSYSEGGAITDVDADGRPDLVLNETGSPPQLVWLRAPDWQRHVIASGVDTRDILAVTLLGHRGVLVVHRQMQVRFYEIPADPAAPWPLQDLYSFYTPSREGGLAIADIDGDGLPDILCGNDWIRSPKKFDLHWRLFAINTWNVIDDPSPGGDATE